MTLASALVSLHRFRDGLAHAQRALRIEPDNPAALAQVASTDGRARPVRRREPRCCAPARAARETNVALDTASARYDELTGKLRRGARARSTARSSKPTASWTTRRNRARGTTFAPASSRGPPATATTAERRFREALDIFPDYARAWNGLARLYWGERRWPEALDAATRAAELVPLPETLGYEADAQRALGDGAAARATDDLIDAIARIGTPAVSTTARWRCTSPTTAAGSTTRSPSRAATSPRATTSSRKTRWRGRSRAAAAAPKRAPRRAKPCAGTPQDARLQYHAGAIAMTCGDRAEGAAGCARRSSSTRSSTPSTPATRAPARRPRGA